MPYWWRQACWIPMSWWNTLPFLQPPITQSNSHFCPTASPWGVFYRLSVLFCTNPSGSVFALHKQRVPGAGTARRHLAAQSLRHGVAATPQSSQAHFGEPRRRATSHGTWEALARRTMPSGCEVKNDSGTNSEYRERALPAATLPPAVYFTL